MQLHRDRCPHKDFLVPPLVVNIILQIIDFSEYQTTEIECLVPGKQNFV